ncbi:hypothetical protein NE237_030715 [Protea cynaroides]|uniref:Uncharacterized protein n=1 Tax=Protea cynaroides TaxID=273540 RepID=A0A9Q0JXJ9_9MAGN|nr:hypothetical protein NE237_030715 [Protea cynaroides]
MNSFTSLLFPSACTSESLHDLSRPLYLTPLATVQDLSPSVGVGDDDFMCEDSWYARPKDNTCQYCSSNEEREEVACLARTISNSSSGEHRIELFVKDSSGINFTMDWDGVSRPDEAVLKL